MLLFGCWGFLEHVFLPKETLLARFDAWLEEIDSEMCWKIAWTLCEFYYRVTTLVLGF